MIKQYSQVSVMSILFLISLTDSPAPGKSGIAAEWKALRAFSDAPRQAHMIPCKRGANNLQSAWYLPEACSVYRRSRPKYQNIQRMSDEPASQLSSVYYRQGVQLLVMNSEQRKMHHVKVWGVKVRRQT